METRKRILVAPLNWGLGHATRCIPIINALVNHNFEPVIASDGVALQLLKKEYPALRAIELPSYNITYSEKGRDFKLKLLKDSPKILKAINAEKKLISNLITTLDLKGIISDNRLGIYNSNIPSVFISHQLNVLSGSTSWLSSKMHQNVIKKFDQCWVPDTEKEPNLSGKLGHLKHEKTNIKYIGPLSRFKKFESKMVFDLMVLLSGPEPQRTILEHKLLEELKKFKGTVIFIKGLIDGQQSIVKTDNMIVYNFMTSKELEKAINRSKMVLSRSGYTTIMDLSKLEKKAFFIPTPGQFEQEYLAKRLHKLGLVPSCKQDEFKIEMLNTVNDTKGLSYFKHAVNFKNLFGLFQGKRELTTDS